MIARHRKRFYSDQHATPEELLTEDASLDLEAYNRGQAPWIGGALPMQFEHVSKQRVVMTMIVDHRTHQPMGLLHGGASVVLAESAASTGAGLNCAEGMIALGQEINANHLRSKRDGVLRATALPVHIGRTTQSGPWRSATRRRSWCASPAARSPSSPRRPASDACTQSHRRRHQITRARDRRRSHATRSARATSFGRPDHGHQRARAWVRRASR